MPFQNRVTPLGTIIADPARGLLMGNRGILHGRNQTLGRARWRHRHWVTCLLIYEDWHRDVMQPHRYTELFFLDEVTALAAGHRPCALCRRKAYNMFRTALARALGRAPLPSADALDQILHDARTVKGSLEQRRFEARLDDMPDGSMVRLGRDSLTAWLVWGEDLFRWRPSGYDHVVKRHACEWVEVLTPRPTVLALQQGYRPDIHPTVRDLWDNNQT